MRWGLPILSLLWLASCCPATVAQPEGDAGTDAGIDAGPLDRCLGVSCTAPESCEPDAGSCACYGEVCSSAWPCSSIVQGCQDVPPTCPLPDGSYSGNVAFVARDCLVDLVPLNGVVEVLIGEACTSQGETSEVTGGALPPGTTLTDGIEGPAINGTVAPGAMAGLYRFRLTVHDYVNMTTDSSWFAICVFDIHVDGGYEDCKKWPRWPLH